MHDKPSTTAEVYRSTLENIALDLTLLAKMAELYSPVAPSTLARVRDESAQLLTLLDQRGTDACAA